MRIARIKEEQEKYQDAEIYCEKALSLIDTQIDNIEKTKKEDSKKIGKEIDALEQQKTQLDQFPMDSLKFLDGLINYSTYEEIEKKQEAEKETTEKLQSDIDELKKEKLQITQYMTALFPFKCMEALKNEDVKSLLKFCDQQLEHDPKNADAFFYRAEAYLLISDIEHALSDLEKSILYKPELPRSYERIALIRKTQGRYEEAEQYTSQAMQCLDREIQELQQKKQILMERQEKKADTKKLKALTSHLANLSKKRNELNEFQTNLITECKDIWVGNIQHSLGTLAGIFLTQMFSGPSQLSSNIDNSPTEQVLRELRSFNAPRDVPILPTPTSKRGVKGPSFFHANAQPPKMKREQTHLENLLSTLNY